MNDAPAFDEENIGKAMDASRIDVARAAADRVCATTTSTASWRGSNRVERRT